VPASDEEDQKPGAPVYFCPSAQPDVQNGLVFGVVGGTPGDPRVSYLESPLPVTPELLGLSEPVHPTEVFRFGAPCAQSGCQHYDGNHCGLIQQIVVGIPPVASTLVPCRLRPRCRWWHEEGAAACIRCPLVVTQQPNPSPEMARAALPRTRAGHSGAPHVRNAR
jgi:hypothetical protein